MSAYGRFAVDYDLLFDDVELRLGTTTPGVRAVLSGLRAGSRVLDAACGIGLDATWLARRGIGVTAADASAAMVAATRARLDDVGCAAEVVECTWLDLPGRLPVGSFDVVLCVGNSIGHCPDEATTVAVLRAFHRMLAPGGVLVLDTHHWEVLAEQGDIDELDPTVIERRGRRVQRRYRWHWSSDRRRCDITFVIEDEAGAVVSQHTVTQQPFTVGALTELVRAAGLTEIWFDAHPDADRYTVTGRAPVDV